VNWVHGDLCSRISSHVGVPVAWGRVAVPLPLAAAAAPASVAARRASSITTAPASVCRKRRWRFSGRPLQFAEHVALETSVTVYLLLSMQENIIITDTHCPDFIIESFL
jgi:hypothetical protein